MPDSETFDAFYARTVWRVTSQMHELADDEGLADHAIREAYARAYQQWYEVSGYRDSEEWVLTAAREAYERRRAEAGGDRQGAAAQPAESGTWPGIYRPRPDASSHAAADLGQPVDPDATVARPARPGRPQRSGGFLAGYPATGRMAVGKAGLSQPVSRKTLLIAGSVIAALLIASVAYLASGGHPNSAAASKGNTTPAVSKPKVQMLRAGKTGTLTAVPWSLVGTGWALAEFSTAQPSSTGQSSGTGTFTTYLVDPEGGKYTITTSSGSGEPQLMAWSGDTKTALFDTAGASGYQLLNVRTGQLTPLPLPTGVVAIGFSRPEGQAILAVSEGPAKFRLQRYTLAGQLEDSLATLPRKSGEALGGIGCATACALSSPDGLTDVWGITGDGMEMLSNQGGKATRPHVQGSGHPSLCMPVTWWNDTTVLANCSASGGLGGASRLWLVPEAGLPTPLTAVAGSPAGAGNIESAWRAGSAVYITQTSLRQCPSAASGPGGMNILPVGQSANAAIMIPGSTRNVATIVTTSGEQLLVLAQTSCPGTSSLLWFNPSSHQSIPVISAPGNEVGVIAAVPFGNGPTAVTNGDY